MIVTKARICKNGHQAFHSIECRECRNAQAARYRAKRDAAQKLIAEALARPKIQPTKPPTTKPMEERITRTEVEHIKARAKRTAEKALALAASRAQQETKPIHAPQYVEVPGAGYSVRRHYP